MRIKQTKNEEQSIGTRNTSKEQRTGKGDEEHVKGRRAGAENKEQVEGMKNREMVRRTGTRNEKQ